MDIRFVSATNRDLEADTDFGGLRGDLFYRLSGAVLRVPPLRERRCEIERLAGLFLQRAARMTGRPPARLAPDALAWLLDHGWPGNIRELRNLMERTALLCRSPEIGLQDLMDEPEIHPIAVRSEPVIRPEPVDQRESAADLPAPLPLLSDNSRESLAWPPSAPASWPRWNAAGGIRPVPPASWGSRAPPCCAGSTAWTCPARANATIASSADPPVRDPAETP